MSAQDAMQFLKLVRDDEAMRQTLVSRRCTLGASELAELGREAGLSFDAADLLLAFRHDWALRALQARKGTA